MFYYETDKSFLLGCKAQLIEDDFETASTWASKHIRINPANAWIVGKFIEAERPNQNKQVFTMDALQLCEPTITHAPMNINHERDNVVGAFVAAEMLLPTSADSANDLPYIETAGVMWKLYYPDAYEEIKKAHDSGMLFQSMECMPRALQTVGGSDDTVEYAYRGRTHESYPDEINERSCEGIKLLDPHFIGGAQILPPVRPGWKHANVREVSDLMVKQWESAELAYEQIKQANPDQDARAWEETMLGFLSLAAQFETA